MKVGRFTLALSVISIIASIAIVSIRGLNVGIDFSGGILIEARIKNLDSSDIGKIRDLLTKEISDVQIQNIDKEDIIIKLSEDKNIKQSKIVDKIKGILSANYSEIEYRKIDFVGPQVGAETILKGIYALLTSLIFIMIYIWVRFDWQFGLGGIIALFHDAALTIGFYSVTGLEFNTTSIAAILTVVGYSINDSVVIYDRIRENLRKSQKGDLSDLINSSINSTLSRTILTVCTTLLSLLALILFGGDALKSFSMATFFGIVVGTYSSIYISTATIIYSDPRLNKKREVTSY